MNLTFRTLSVDHLSDICFAEIIYISPLLNWSCFEQRPVPSKTTTLTI